MKEREVKVHVSLCFYQKPYIIPRGTSNTMESGDIASEGQGKEVILLLFCPLPFY